MPIVVDVLEATSTLTQLLKRVEAGERVVIVRDGRPVADLIAHRRSEVRFGTGAGLIAWDADTFDAQVDEVTHSFER